MLNKFLKLFAVFSLVFVFNASASLLVIAQPSSALPAMSKLRLGGLKEGTSTNWSGYAVETNLTTPQSGAVSDVKGSWVVPTLTCSSATNYSSAWVGIDGYSSSSVEQTGTEHDCINGQPRFYAWFEMYPKRSFLISGLAIHAGDLMNAEVKYLGSNRFDLILQDVTTGKSFSTVQKTSNVRRSSAEWIVEAPYSGGVLPLANFGTLNFTNAKATVNNHLGVVNDSAWQNDRIDMVNGSVFKDQTSSLSSSGDSFSVLWKSN